MDKHRAEDCGKGTPATADSARMLYNVDARHDRSISRQDMTIADCEMTVSRSAISLMMVTATSEGVGFVVSCCSLIMSRRSLTLSRCSPPVSVRSLLLSTTAVWIETTVVAVIVMMPLGGVWAGLAGVVHVALNRINCEENRENTLVNEFLLLNLHAINFKNTYVIICCR